MVIIAKENGCEVRAEWEDETYYGNRAFLALVPVAEKAYGPTPEKPRETPALQNLAAIELS